MKKRYVNNQELLEKEGWPAWVLEEIYHPQAEKDAGQAFYQSQLFGSQLFQDMWTLASRVRNAEEAEALLELAMQVTGMPEELLGSPEEAQELLEHFADIAPASPFWRTFSLTVQTAFPEDSFTSRGGNERLKRQIHQFRYVISAQQAQWVRQHFKQTGMTDADALATYFRSDQSLNYAVGPSARLHNKAFINRQTCPPKIVYPSGQTYQANFKVLMDFHTEFILDCDGNFLNELDPDGMTVNGIVNGASFNYGDDDTALNEQAHSRYDVRPPGVWDPAYRDYVVRNQGCRFVAPKYDKSENGYLSKDGFYAREGKSAKDYVDQACRDFERLVAGSRWRFWWQSLWRNLGQLFPW